MSRLFSELRRRKVFNTAATYLAVAFVVLQVADLTFEPLGLPASAYRALIILAAVGFPLALVLSWLFDIRRDTMQSRSVGAVLVAFVVLCTAAMAYGVARHWKRANYDVDAAIAVLPFKVIGSPNLSYLESGIVEIVGRNIDGAAHLRAIPSDEVLSYTIGKHLTPDELAAKLNTRYLVTGDISQVGEAIRFTFAVNDYKKNKIGAPHVVDGKVNDLFEVVDRVSAQVLAATRGGQDAHLAESAATTTHSLDALRKYFAGEDLYRRLEYDSAAAQFADALATDSTFALAYYRRAIVDLESGRRGRVRVDVTGALRNERRVPGRDRTLIEALADRLEGRFDAAEARYRRLLELYPGDLEATYQLARVILSENEMTGRDVAEAEPYFDKVAAADPEFLCPI